MNPRITLAGVLAVLLTVPGGGRAFAQSHAHKPPRSLRIKVPFTPMNADGSPSKPVLVTIKVEVADREQALEVLDQIVDQLIVQPKIDDVLEGIQEELDQINGELDNSPRTVNQPANPAPVAPDATAPVSPPATLDVELVLPDLLDGALGVLDMVGSVLGVPVNLRFLGIPTHIDSSDPNTRMESLLHQEGPGGSEGEWLRWGLPVKQDLPSHMQYERIHGGIGP
jgi:hypothetical protein